MGYFWGPFWTPFWRGCRGNKGLFAKKGVQKWGRKVDPGVVGHPQKWSKTQKRANLHTFFEIPKFWGFSFCTEHFGFSPNYSSMAPLTFLLLYFTTITELLVFSEKC